MAHFRGDVLSLRRLCRYVRRATGLGRGGARSLRHQLLRLNLMLGGVALLVFSAAAVGVLIALRAVEHETVEERVERARAFLARQAKVRQDRTEEYAYWDEMWQRVGAPITPATEQFFQENFVDWFPPRYGDDLITVWNRHGRVVLSWADTTVPAIDLVIPDSLRLARPARPALSGFVATPRGLVLFSAAPTLPTDYREALDRPSGYVLIAAWVDDSLVAAWSTILQSRLAILPAGAWAGVKDDHVVRRVAGDSVEARFALRDPLGRIAAVAAVADSRGFIARLDGFLLQAYAAAVLFLVLSTALLWRRNDRLFSRPLSAIVRELRAMPAGGQLRPLTADAPATEWNLFIASFNATVHALEETQGRYRALFDSAGDALFLTEASTGIVLDANPAAAQLLARPRESFAGQALTACLGLSEPVLPEGMVRVFRADGSAVMVSAIASPVTSGGVFGTLASLRDLTEREALRAQVRDAHAQKMEAIGVLAGGVAHDFNNMLGALLVAVSSLREGVDGDAARDAVQTIESSARRAADLTRQLLRFARKETVPDARVDLGEVAAGVERLCRRTLGPRVRLQIVVPEGLPPVTGDAGQLEQALLNLCINARDAMPDGGTIRIALASRRVSEDEARDLEGVTAGSHVVLSVTDSGCGMTPDVARRIFEPFFTTKPAGKGTGLGLAMVYGCVRAHRGGIRVISVPGRGTRFDLFLPAGAALSRRPVAAAAAPEEPARGCETILLADDEDLLRRAAANALRRLGYTVIEAADGDAAIERFTAERGDVALVVTDMAMPRAGGPEVYRAVRAMDAVVPVLVCSGSPDGDEIRELIEAGVAGVLSKPFDIAALAVAVRTALDNGRQATATVPVGASVVPHRGAIGDP